MSIRNLKDKESWHLFINLTLFQGTLVTISGSGFDPENAGVVFGGTAARVGVLLFPVARTASYSVVILSRIDHAKVITVVVKNGRYVSF